ncbi:penicillin acylase family protein [Algiphilus aromaticivorans]|uniref:penicillin acylase family protein n=1 Tax=Algiphilus aromaticivorans TaxID=382454 RepID=UPI0005C1AF75|nr:penicillin acylase family protein [Algiphilus aromaticivorans]
MLRWMSRLLALIVVLVLAVGASAALLLWASLPMQEGSLKLRGLGAPVEILRDADGVATISAASRIDAARATGFLHAQERFFQMDLARRSGAGELAALLGPRALPLDRQRRIFELRAHARRELQALPRAEQDLLYAYADGVNAGLGALRAHPFEYLLLRQTPERWRAEDALLVAGAMYFMLTDSDASHALQRAQLLAAGGEALHDYLLPAATPWDAPLQGEAAPLPEPPSAGVLDLRAMPAERFEGQPARTRRISGLGSNAFAVAGERTATGAALVAGDMHLGLSIPNTWYRLRLRVTGEDARDATGVTLPGLPLIISGSNGRVAWAFTNSYGIWFGRIRVPASAVRERELTLAVAGDENATMRLLESDHGPVVPGLREGEWHALRWLPVRSGVSNLDLLGMETATDVEGALDVLNGSGIPPQSAVVGGGDGRIAWTIAGRIPARAGSAAELPLAPEAVDSWNGWLPDADYPSIIDPPAGHLASANARMLAGEALARVGDAGTALGARQSRLRELVAAADNLDAAGALAIQRDVHSDWLEAWAAELERLLDTSQAEARADIAALRALMADWQPEARVDNRAYSLVRRWQTAVHERVMHALTAPVRAEYPDFVLDAFPVSQAAVLDVVQRQPAHLLDPRFDAWPDFLLAALDGALDADAEAAPVRPWGVYNQLDMRHPLSGALPGLGRLLDMPAEPLPGDADVVRVQGPSFGASQRMAITVGAEGEAIFHMPGGQSGHPASPHYRAGHTDWAVARAAPLLPGRAVARLELRP